MLPLTARGRPQGGAGGSVKLKGLAERKLSCKCPEGSREPERWYPCLRRNDSPPMGDARQHHQINPETASGVLADMVCPINRVLMDKVSPGISVRVVMKHTNPEKEVVGSTTRGTDHLPTTSVTLVNTKVKSLMNKEARDNATRQS